MSCPCPPSRGSPGGQFNARAPSALDRRLRKIGAKLFTAQWRTWRRAARMRPCEGAPATDVGSPICWEAPRELFEGSPDDDLILLDVDILRLVIVSGAIGNWPIEWLPAEGLVSGGAYLHTGLDALAFRARLLASGDLGLRPTSCPGGPGTSVHAERRARQLAVWLVPRDGVRVRLVGFLTCRGALLSLFLRARDCDAAPLGTRRASRRRAAPKGPRVWGPCHIGWVSDLLRCAPGFSAGAARRRSDSIEHLAAGRRGDL